jgi:tungstate transport system substrate-binding protein
MSTNCNIIFLRTTKYFIQFFLLFILLANDIAYAEGNKLIRLATTTSTQNSGLLDTLLPQFEKDTGLKVHTIAVGTGKALRMGRDGDVDVILVHALNEEKLFIANGHGKHRFAVMYNDFVIVGPKNDPAKLASSKTVVEAFQKIADSKALFISRGDNSGTHKKELSLWKTAKIPPQSLKNQWYREAGQGMGKVLQIAGEMDAYTLTDRGTWLAYQSKSPLSIVFEGDSSLFNPYGIIAVNPEKYPDVNNTGALTLIKWITSKKGQALIEKFKIAGKTLFIPSASSEEKVR